MKQGMSFDMRRRCELVMTRFRGGTIPQADALQEIFKLMRLPEAAKVQASEFQDYVDALMVAAENPRDAELEKEIAESWKA